MKDPSNMFSENPGEGERSIHSELWHACAGPLVFLPPVGSLVVYFPQGHSEQVAASMQRNTDGIPSYPNLPAKLICMLHHATLHADTETDEVYAQMTLQPVNKCDKEALLASDMDLKQSKQPAEFFCKTLTASDTSTHGGFSVPRRAAEKIFPPLDFSMQPPCRELVARDFHDVAWTFRHVYRGQPKRHLLTTGWSVFVNTKRLCAGDSVLFIRDEKAQLLLGIKRANRQISALSSSVISSDSMHIGILAAAAHAAANNSPFTIFYNPRTSPSEFVVPLAKYYKAMYNQVSLGMRFRMMFETEESGVRRYMGTITGISDLDSVRWKNSQWRKLQVGWDESTAGVRPSRVSIWEIEPVTTPFYICPPSFFRSNFPKQPGMQDEELDIDNTSKRAMPWLGDDLSIKDGQSPIFQGLSLVQWMSMQQNPQFSAAQPGFFPSMVSSAAEHNNRSTDGQSKILNFQSHALPASNFEFDVSKTNQQNQQEFQFQQSPIAWPQQHRPTLVYPQQQQQHPQQQQQQRQQLRKSAYNNNGVTPTQIPNQNLQQPIVYSQLHQKQLLTHNTQFQQDLHLPNQDSLQPASLSQDLQFQRQIDHPQNLTHHQFQLQTLQKLQQQLLPQVSPQVQSQLPQQQQARQQNEQLQQQQPLQHQFSTTTNSSPPPLNQRQQFPSNHILNQHKPPIPIRANSGPTDRDAPSCSTSPSANNCQVSPSSFLNRNHQGLAHNLVQELQSEPDFQIKHKVPKSKEPDHLLYRGAFTDPLEASLSNTSYCLDGGNLQKNLLMPNFCFDGEVQADPHSDHLIGINMDGLATDTVLSRGFSSEKDRQNLLSSYGGTQKDLETELSTAEIGSQSFELPYMSFKPGLTDAAINESGLLNTGLWANQLPQHMRTFTKVQKRGSVGRSIDVTRYKGYDELRHDLAHMFGIQGQLEDPHSTEWKLVYLDPENDILLVGDDPWEVFVSCVQSIKILSSTEVQQMSLNGDLGHVHAQIHVNGGSDDGNGWRGHNDVNIAALFDQ